YLLQLICKWRQSCLRRALTPARRNVRQFKQVDVVRRGLSRPLLPRRLNPKRRPGMRSRVTRYATILALATLLTGLGALALAQGAAGETRVFGEQLGPGRASRAMAIVHIAIFDAVNAFTGEWQSFTEQDPAPPGASMDAAIAQAAHDTLASLYPSQADTLDAALAEDLASIAPNGKQPGRRVGGQAAAAILAARRNDGSERPEPRVGIDFITSD